MAKPVIVVSVQLSGCYVFVVMTDIKTYITCDGKYMCDTDKLTENYFVGADGDALYSVEHTMKVAFWRIEKRNHG